MKYRINIPKGKKVTSGEVKGNDIVIHLADEFTPKDGDVCLVIFYNGKVGLFIYRENNENKKFSYYAGVLTSEDINDTHVYKAEKEGISSIAENTAWYKTFRLAKEEEKEILMDIIKEKYNQTFNFETKKFEDIRWRAEEGDSYECIIVDDEGVRIAEFTDFRGFTDDGYFNSENYYNPADHEETERRRELVEQIVTKR